MKLDAPQQGLSLANELIAEGHSTFTFKEVEQRLGKSKPATANLLKRMTRAGLIDRVRRGHYALRQLGMLGTPAAAEDIAMSVSAAFKGLAHRMAYRSALYEHDLLVHPPPAIQVATQRRVRTRALSGRRLQVVIESPEKLDVGRIAQGDAYISDLHRTILDAAHRPRLVGGAEVLAQAFAAAAPHLKPDILIAYARRLGYAAALRRLGSLADNLVPSPLPGTLEPIKPITADLDLEPGSDEPTVWRDKRWRLRWPRSVDELQAVIGQ